MRWEGRQGAAEVRELTPRLARGYVERASSTRCSVSLMTDPTSEQPHAIGPKTALNGAQQLPGGQLEWAGPSGGRELRLNFSPLAVYGSCSADFRCVDSVTG